MCCFVGEPEGNRYRPTSLLMRWLPIQDEMGGLRGRWSPPSPPLCYRVFTPLLLPARIVRFPWQMGEEKVRRIFREALKIWSDVTPLTFTEVHSGKADIRIDFTRWGWGWGGGVECLSTAHSTSESHKKQQMLTKNRYKTADLWGICVTGKTPTLSSYMVSY